MAQQSTLDVSKWQEGRRKWLYMPTLWFFYRMIEVAYLDAKTKADGKPTDEALLARDWIARSELAPAMAPHEFVSFPECCRVLGLDADCERVALLDAIDKANDADNDESWARLAELSERAPMDDIEPLFDAPRIVPALDQITLF